MKYKYTYKYFKNSMPDWKKKKDPIFIKLFFRPISFFGAAFCARFNISANVVTIFSLFIAIVACGLFFLPNYSAQLVGAILINFWLLLDCIDGNLARSVKQQPFGEFLDAMGSYLLVALLGISLGYSVFCNGGLFIKSGNVFSVILGAMAASTDTLMRLTYQKYKNVSIDLQNKGVIEKEYDIRTDHQSVSNLRIRIEMELGIGGILPPMILLCTVFGFLDIIVVYLFCYSMTACAVTIISYIIKTLKYLDVSIR